jgi:hypothetical protein
MSPPLMVVEAAASFWADAGVGLAFPRDIRRAVARSQPIFIVMLPALYVAKAEAWLRRQGKAIELDVPDRPLQACLVAQGGAGFIFVDGEDSENEQRYSIAHELAHFLLDYLGPRHAAVARLGEGILEVLDGLRPARAEERVIGIITGATVRRHVHLMGRNEDFDSAEDIDRAESIADALALELLAPWEVISRQIVELGINEDRAAISNLLMDHFGLPIMPAARYAASLSPDPAPVSPLLRYLRGVELAKFARNTS